ncbi:MAG: ATP-binding protein, partial [Candidatus Eremiobacteraeota bacterium]|nr:ATP-binding protein [Candidatus Eremiobacteraeota bacterium]
MKIFGREKELRALREFLFASGGSGPRVALISGEAGMGKSLLARKLRPEVSERGGLFMEVTCNP